MSDGYGHNSSVYNLNSHLVRPRSHYVHNVTCKLGCALITVLMRIESNLHELTILPA